MQTALFMFKVDCNLLPLHLIKSFYQNCEIHHYCTKSSDNYHVESVNTNVKQFVLITKVRFYGILSHHQHLHSITLVNPNEL